MFARGHAGKFEGFDVVASPSGQSILFAGCQLQLQRGNDLLCKFVLNGENIGEFSIEPVGPDMPAIAGIDQLGGDPDPVAGLAHAAFEHVADAERLRRLGQETAAFL